MDVVPRCLFKLVVGVSLLAVVTRPASGESQSARFQLLQDESSAWAVSADGNIVIGSSGNAVTYRPFRWNIQGSIQFLSSRVELRDLSSDGNIIVGNGIGRNGFRWSTSHGDLPAPQDVIEVRGASAGGDVLTGSFSHLQGREAYRWTELEGLSPLGDLPGGEFFSVAEAVSADGSTIVGQSYSQLGPEPFIWSASLGIQSLGSIHGNPFRGWAFDISDNAQTVVGLTYRDDGASEAFTWNRFTGRTELGDLAGGAFYSFAHGVSADGSVAVGIATDDSGETAFVRDRLHGMRKIQEVLQSQLGLDPNIHLTSAWDVSADGRTIVGSARVGNGALRAYVAYLPDVVPEPSTFCSSLLAVATVVSVRFQRFPARVRKR